MLKNTLVLLLIVATAPVVCLADDARCLSKLSMDDIIAVGHDQNGNVVQYRRNRHDIEAVISTLKQKLAADPSLREASGWSDRMLTVTYWAKERCGGTKDCSSKECSAGKSCVYSNIGMAGCRCQ